MAEDRADKDKAAEAAITAAETGSGRANDSEKGRGFSMFFILGCFYFAAQMIAAGVAIRWDADGIGSDTANMDFIIDFILFGSLGMSLIFTGFSVFIIYLLVSAARRDGISAGGLFFGTLFTPAFAMLFTKGGADVYLSGYSLPAGLIISWLICVPACWGVLRICGLTEAAPMGSAAAKGSVPPAEFVKGGDIER